MLIGWSGDREALRAVRRAMPFLHQATRLEIAVVDPSGPDENPGEELAVYLSRHGLAVEISAHPRAGKSIGEALRRRATDIDADLLIMGAYGHSRFREAVIGGVTRDMLAHAEVPLLLAH